MIAGATAAILRVALPRSGIVAGLRAGLSECAGGILWRWGERSGSEADQCAAKQCDPLSAKTR